MKKQITRLSSLFLAFLMMASIASLNAENRIYLIGDAAGIPNNASYTNSTFEDVWIWQETWTPEQTYTAYSEAGVDAGPTGSYLQYTAQVTSYIGLSYVWLYSTKDLSQITDDWYLHMEVKTNITTAGQDFWLMLGGANESQASFYFTEDAYPIAERDNTTWYEIEVPMYEFFDAGLDYSEPLVSPHAYINMLIGGTTPNVSQFAIDNVYFTDKGVSGINDAKESLDFKIAGDMLQLADGATASVYDIQGKLVMNVNESASLASLTEGVYILRSGNKVAKFVK